MRTQFLFVGLLSAVTGALVGTAGCDSLTSGQPSDPPGGPQLVHITVQDAVANGNRNTVVDLLDNAPPIACSDIDPCVSQFNFNFSTPDFTCSATMPGVVGTCNDPLKVTKNGVPLNNPIGAAGDAGSGQQIRIVFNKILDNTIETVTMDPTQVPGKTNKYALVPTVAKLSDPNNKEVDSVKFYDNGGSPSFTSDLILAPLGPAIVIRPTSPLAPLTKYTISLDTSQIKDRQGNAPVDQNGAALPNPYTLSFTTEGIVSNPAAPDYPDFTGTAPFTISPNEVLQFNFFTTVDEATAMVTLTGPGGAVTFEAYSDRADDPMMCNTNLNPSILNVAHVSAPGVASDWPAGDYTISFTVKSDLNPAASYTSDTLQFTVTGSDQTDVKKHPQIVTAHVLPEQCMGTM